MARLHLFRKIFLKTLCVFTRLMLVCFTILAWAQSAYSEVSPALLVDFGANSSDNRYGVSGWDTVHYAGVHYSSAGPRGLETNEGERFHNYQRITGPALKLEAGDEIVVTWYNNTGSSLGGSGEPWYPLVSFDDSDKPDDHDGQPQWFVLKDPDKMSDGWTGGAGEIIIPSGGIFTSIYVVTSDVTILGHAEPTQGDHTNINISANSKKAGIVCDKIELIRASDTKPSRPGNLQAAHNPNYPTSAIDLSWTAPTQKVDHYRIYRDDLWINKVYDETLFTDYTAANSTTYTYTVQAYRNPENFSEMSAPVSIATASFQEADKLIDPQKDVEYLGAFRFPKSPTSNYEWSYRAGGIAFYPPGDPENVDGDSDFPGSLYSFGHINYRQVAEISIPEPVKSKNYNDLPRAQMVQGFHDVMPDNTPSTSLKGSPGLAYVARENRFYMTFPDNYNFSSPKKVSHGSFKPDFSDVQGLWMVGKKSEPYNPEYYAYTAYISEIPEEWTSTYTPGMSLISGNTWGNPHLGPSLIALKVPPYDNVTTLAPGAELAFTPLVLYDHRNTPAPKTLNGFYWRDGELGPGFGFHGVGWLTSGNKSAVIMGGRESFGEFYYGYDDGTIWKESLNAVPEIPPVGSTSRGGRARFCSGAILFYNPEDLAKVAQGTLRPNEPQPYETFLFDDFFIDNDITSQANKIAALAFDADHHILYIVQGGLDGGSSVIHAFRVGNSIAPTHEETLTITKQGTGQGTVTSTPAGIACGTACNATQANFKQGITVTIMAAPTADSQFAGWSGACSGTSPACQVSMDQTIHASAAFILDTDQDGLPDADDNCPNVVNPDQLNTDHDGSGDVCDACRNDPDNDRDNDGICGDIDNCPQVSNVDQLDADSNGAGDVCEDPVGSIELFMEQTFQVDRGGDPSMPSVFRGDAISYSLTATNFFNIGVELMISEAMSAFVDYIAGTLRINGEITDDDWSYLDGNLFEFGPTPLMTNESFNISFDVIVNSAAPLNEHIDMFASGIAYSISSPDALFFSAESNLLQAQVKMQEPVPEPSTVMLFGIGILGIFTLVRKTKAQ